MDAIISNPAQLYLIAGLLLLGIDIFLIGLSPLMFIAIGALVTSGILYVSGWKTGILHLIGWNPGVLEPLVMCALISLLAAVAGRRPLQAFQNSNVQEDKSSDLIGREVVTTHEVTRSEGCLYWSGTLWQARLADSARVERVGPGVRMQVEKVKNLALILRPAD
jgi:inner membrane protein